MPEISTVTNEDFVLDVSKDLTTDKNFASQGFWKGVLTRFRKNKRAMTGLVIILVIFVLAVFGPMLSNYGYKEIISIGSGQDVVAKSLSPRIPALHNLFSSSAYQDAFADRVFLFGTDSLGRDLWTRVWYGARISLLIAFVTILIDMLIGMSYGLISGYFGGIVDVIMQRILEISNGIPRLVIVTLLLLVLKPGLLTIIFALLLTEWIGMSRISRAEMLKLKDQEFVLATRTLGAKHFHIIFKDILPNIIGPVITQVMFSIPTAIFTEAFLSFVGLGIPVPQCSLGSLISDAFNSFTTHPYQIVPPIIVMALLMLSFNLVADGLREALDPKMKEM
jgi:oligopeptide transport system permease protein